MNDAEVRLKLSRETLYKWRAMGGPSGPLEDILRMLGEEVTILQSMLSEHPALYESITVLIEGYEDLRSELRRKTH